MSVPRVVYSTWPDHSSSKLPAGGGQTRHRPIIVRFASRRDAQNVLRERKNLKGTKIVCVEDLTNERYSLLRKAKDNDRVESAWSSRGKILVKLKGREKIREIKTIAEIAQE